LALILSVGQQSLTHGVMGKMMQIRSFGSIATVAREAGDAKDGYAEVGQHPHRDPEIMYRLFSMQTHHRSVCLGEIKMR